MAKDRISSRKSGLQDRAKDTVNYIFEATIQLLQEKGIGGITTNKIVERAGISIGTLYEYFPNKESVLHHLIERLFTRLADDMVETIRSLDIEGLEPKEAVDLLIERFFKNNNEKQGVFRQFFFSMVSLEHLKFMLKNDAKVAEALKEKFLPYKDQLQIEDWDQSIFMLLYALKGIQFGVLFGNVQIPQEKLRAEVSRMVYQYLKGV